MEGFLSPSQILDRLDLSPSMIAADFGAGSGGWAIPLAKKLDNGKVFAIDILEEPLSALKSKAKLEKVWNIQTICANVEDLKGAKMGGGAIDLVLMTNLLFQSDKKEDIFKEANRILKSGGKVLVADWLSTSSVGPQEGNVDPEEVKKIAKEGGFELEKEFSASPHHFGIIFVKP